MEYNVCQDDIRKTEEKYQLNENGLPIGKFSSSFAALTLRHGGT